MKPVLDPKDEDKLKPYATRLFINDTQTGDNATFQDWFVSDEVAIQDAKDYFGEIYPVVEVTLENLSRWPHTAPVPTLVVKCRTERP